MIMIMTNCLITVQHKLAMLKAMEDGGTTVAGLLISTSNTILLNMGPYFLLAHGTIRGGLK